MHDRDSERHSFREQAIERPLSLNQRFAEVADVITSSFKHRAEVSFVHVQSTEKQILVGFLDEKVIRIRVFE